MVGHFSPILTSSKCLCEITVRKQPEKQAVSCPHQLHVKNQGLVYSVRQYRVTCQLSWQSPAVHPRLFPQRELAHSTAILVWSRGGPTLSSWSRADLSTLLTSIIVDSKRMNETSFSTLKEKKVEFSGFSRIYKTETEVSLKAICNVASSVHGCGKFVISDSKPTLRKKAQCPKSISTSSWNLILQ